MIRNHDFISWYNNDKCSINLDLNPFMLKKDFSPNQKRKFRLPKDSKYDSIINANGDEVVIIDPSILAIKS